MPATIDIGGRSLAVYCAGDGDPMVVLEAALTDPADVWREVQAGVMAFTRVCSYDRAGRGASDPASKPRTVDEAAADLHALLDRVGTTLPVVLAGHSFGGLIVQRYAQIHPERVAGLVLIDSSHPRQMETILGTLPPERPDEGEALAFFRATFVEMYDDPEMNVEGVDLAGSMREIGDPRPLGDLPVAVLTAETVFSDVELPGDVIERLHQVWLGLQAEFVGLSSRSLARVVPGSRHYIFHTHPEEVIDAIRWVVDRSRTV